MGLFRLLQGRMAHRVISCRVFIAFGNVSLGTAIGKLPMEESVVTHLNRPKTPRLKTTPPIPSTWALFEYHSSESKHDKSNAARVNGLMHGKYREPRA